MRKVIWGAHVVAATCLAAAPVIAGQHGQSGGHGHSPHTAPPTAHGPTSHGPASHGPTTHGPSSHTTGAPTTKGSSPKTSAPTTMTTVDFTAGPVGQRLSRNTALTSKLETRLAALGYQGTVYEAAYGFRNLGQFVAATNVSRNLGIPFDQLKLQMTGVSVAADGTILRANMAPDGTIALVDPADATSPAPTKSLGQSIHTIDTTVDSTAAAQTATTQASADID